MQIAESELEEGELPRIASTGSGQSAHENGKATVHTCSTAEHVRAPLFATETSEYIQYQKNKKNKKCKGGSSGYHDVYGTQAHAEVEIRPEEGQVRISDVQNLLLWMLAEGNNPRWCFVKNKPLVKGVVMLALHGLDCGMFYEKRHMLPSLNQWFGDPIILQARNATLVPAQTVHALFTVPISKKRKRVDAAKSAATCCTEQSGNRAGGSNDTMASESNNKLCSSELSHQAQKQAPKFVSEEPALWAMPAPPSYYVLSQEQLHTNNYPVPLTDEHGNMICPEGYVFTKPSDGPLKHSMIALDCEMCITELGFELTRVTIVGIDGQVLLDELVLPGRPIIDYNTRYSGITKATLEHVSTSLADIQQKLLDIISAETLVVAHSGENDLRACKLMHANVLDTAVMYPHPKGAPYKSALRVLASRHLLRTIQKESHDPVEDAKAALDLALLKIERGPSYGLQSGEKGEKLVDVLSKQSRVCWLVDSQASLNQHASGSCHAVSAGTDQCSLDGLAKALNNQTMDFLWGQFMDLHKAYEQRVESLDHEIEVENVAASEEFVLRVDNILQEWDSYVRLLWTVAQQGTMFMIVCGQGDTIFSRHMQEQKYRRQQGLDGLSKWSPEAEDHLAKMNAKATSGLFFVGIK